MDKFKLKILNQSFILDDKGVDEGIDLCTHGSIFLSFNDCIVSNEDSDWTISTAGLTLLRTLKSDHDTGNSNFVIFDHCGQLDMIGCPISLTWDVRHEPQHITISNIKKIEATDRQIDQLVYQLYGLTPEEIAIVEGTA